MNTKKILSGSTLKLLAVISMLFDHFGRIVLENGYLMNSTRSMISDEQYARISTMSDVCGWIGRMAFPIFCFLLVEGFVHTKNLKKYMRNLLLFAILTETIYDWSFTGILFNIYQQNVMFELLLGIIALYMIRREEKFVKEKIRVVNEKEAESISIIIAILIIIILGKAAESLYLDGGLYGISLIGMFYLLRKQKIAKFFAGIGILLFYNCYLVGGGFDFSPENFLDISLLAGVSALLLIFGYNGQRGRRVKYFFYAFYPMHLLILKILSVLYT